MVEAKERVKRRLLEEERDNLLRLVYSNAGVSDEARIKQLETVVHWLLTNTKLKN